MRRYIKPAIFLFLIIIAIIFLHNFKILTPVENLSITLLKPIQAPLYSLGSRIFSTAEKKELAELEQENNDLQKRVTELINENSRLTTLIQEYQQLNEQFKYIETQEYQTIPARIIAQTTDQSSNAVIINQGTSQGLVEGLPVLAEEGLIIGKIKSVEKNRATVLLITDNYCQLISQIQNENNSPGLVRGQHGLSLTMELIPKTETIEQGDIVITSGTEEHIPAGLIIGEVEKVDNPPGELWQTALVNTLVDFRQLTIVNVILP